jgi:Acyl-CoA reductase (LuxC)
MSTDLAALERIERLLVALRQALAPGTRQREALAGRLMQTTGLSAAGVEWALAHCLEQSPGDAELARLVAGVSPARRAHVILPASVFVAAHRALALALAATARVFVKPSRREPALIEAVHAQAPGLFELVPRLEPEPGDHVFAYGSDTTLEALRRELPKATVLHAHGSGFGVAVVDLEAAPDRGALDGDHLMARAIAEDTACFDQRGCLSPRFVLALGEPARAQRFAERLAAELAELEQRLPLGRLDPHERADATWYRQCAACYGTVIAAGSGAVSVRDAFETASLVADGTLALEVPPVGRHLEVLAVRRLEPALETLRPWLTTVGCGSPALGARLRPLLEPIRVSALGRMQQPAFDGPVDRRADPRGEII